MRAVLVENFGSPSSLVIADVPEPHPGEGEVVVDVCAAGVNFPDLLVVGGTYQHLPPCPFTPGKEIAGIVGAVGAGVAWPPVGARVCCQVEYGAFADRVVVPANHVMPVPDGVDLKTAAGIGMGFLTAYFALKIRARIERGECVLVTGANGVVGNAAVQLAAALGARVIAQARTGQHARDLTRLGAHEIVIGNAEVLRNRVRRLTDGRGADIVIENVGGTMLTEALRCVAWQGRLVVVGFAGGGEIPAIKVGHLLVKNIGVLGLQTSDYRDREPEMMRQAQAEIFVLLEAGKLHCPIIKTFELTDVADALSMVRKGGLLGKIVLALR